ncbi:hypothetical protein L1987_50805 [Smallanthus sonchifolius]|uniref:Uncharacterized protein n=1 Tax=Smallanthus sonchifolius TaxID=185202 RepID=A0ACB9ENL5_9ASTR|nr:hypothetical protein L1987_50805 [Smallanthus sonchifolius]
MFPFSLRERAKAWLNSLPTGSITTWDDLAQKFLLKYFPPAKTAKLRNDITTFTQDDGESLYEVWERFKDMPRKCPHHGLEVWLQVSSFYNGLHNQARKTLDATAGGIFGNKRPHEAYNLTEEIAMNSYQWYNPQTSKGIRKGVHAIDAVTSLSAQVDALTTRLNRISKGKATPKTMEEVKSITADVKQVDFVGTNRPQNNPYSNTYKPGWRNHPNFSWKDNNQGQFGPTKMGNGISLEDTLTKLISTTESQALLADSRHKQYEERFSLHEAEFKTQKATLQSIETQLGQIAKLLSERQPGCLPSNTETNPKANVSAITLRNKKVYPESPMSGEEVQSSMREIFTGLPLRPQPASSSTQKAQPSVIQPLTADLPPKVPPKRTFNSHIPYLGRLVKQKTDEEYDKFIELLSQIDTRETRKIKRTNYYVALIKRNLPKKLSDPGKLSLPCFIGPLPVTYTHANLGASLNVTPSTMFQKLDIGQPRPVNATIEFTDGSDKTPIGVIENLSVKVGKFVFPADFMVLETGQDFSIPLILGRPFLATVRPVIDMNEGILTLCIGKQSVTYNIGGYECMSSDPLEISHFIDSNLDYQLQKAKDLKKGKAPDLTKPKTLDPTAIDLTKDLDNTNWIDEYFDKLQKLNE